MIKFVKGDLFASKADALVNTINCEGIMGGGIALRFKNEFPNMYKIYVKQCNEGLVRPGICLTYKEQHPVIGNVIVVNFPTKDEVSEPSEYSYVIDGLYALKQLLQDKTSGIESIAIPALGCGLGGLEWGIVKGLIEKHLSDVVDCTILVYEPC